MLDDKENENYWGVYTYTPPHECKFPDTGFYLSWCSCGKEGYFSFKMGKYLPYKD